MLIETLTVAIATTAKAIKDVSRTKRPNCSRIGIRMAIAAPDHRESGVYESIVIPRFFIRAVAVYDVVVHNRAWQRPTRLLSAVSPCPKAYVTPFGV